MLEVESRSMSQHTWSPDVVAIGDHIAALSSVQAAALSRYLADAHGVAAFTVTKIELDPQPDILVRDGQAAPASFDVVLDGCDAGRKISVIKAIRAELGLGLKEAKDLVEAAPRVLKEQLPRSEAEKLQAQLEADGALVSLRPATS
jgi:large subunit ribosomal protein L7/L12